MFCFLFAFILFCSYFFFSVLLKKTEILFFFFFSLLFNFFFFFVLARLSVPNTLNKNKEKIPSLSSPLPRTFLRCLSNEERERERKFFSLCLFSLCHFLSLCHVYRFFVCYVLCCALLSSLSSPTPSIVFLTHFTLSALISLFKPNFFFCRIFLSSNTQTQTTHTCTWLSLPSPPIKGLQPLPFQL